MNHTPNPYQPPGPTFCPEMYQNSTCSDESSCPFAHDFEAMARTDHQEIPPDHPAYYDYPYYNGMVQQPTGDYVDGAWESPAPWSVPSQEMAPSYNQQLPAVAPSQSLTIPEGKSFLKPHSNTSSLQQPNSSVTTSSVSEHFSLRKPARVRSLSTPDHAMLMRLNISDDRPRMQAPICGNFLKTGSCDNSSCTYLHEHIAPPDEKVEQIVGSSQPSTEPSSSSQTVSSSQDRHTTICKYFSSSGWCRFGDSCRFSHDQNSHESSKNVDLANYIVTDDSAQAPSSAASRRQATSMRSNGKPMQESCKFFRDGQCRFGDQCRFKHL